MLIDGRRLIAPGEMGREVWSEECAGQEEGQRVIGHIVLARRDGAAGVEVV